MNPKTSMIAVLLVIGGGIFIALGGVHAIYTLLDLRNPQRLVPADPSVQQAMAGSALRLSQGRTDMWRAWIGFNFSHSLGVLLVGAFGVWAGLRANSLPAAVTVVLTLIGCAYLVLALRYWFWAPALGVAVGTAFFAAAWVRSLL